MPGVVEPAEDLGLEPEALEHARRQQPPAHDLERDAPARRALLGLVDGAHSALTEQAQDAVARDQGAEERVVAQRGACAARVGSAVAGF